VVVHDPVPVDMPDDRARATWRRPAVLLAIALDVVVLALALLALVNGFSPIVLAFAVILAMAPWASILDQREGPGRRG
jgi:hypothetical protein